MFLVSFNCDVHCFSNLLVVQRVFVSRIPLDQIDLHSGFTFGYDFAYTSASQKKHTAISLEFVPPTKDQDFFLLPDTVLFFCIMVGPFGHFSLSRATDVALPSEFSDCL